jgi:hypothetical protein
MVSYSWRPSEQVRASLFGANHSLIANIGLIRNFVHVFGSGAGEFEPEAG